jgi:hypothetical protein
MRVNFTMFSPFNCNYFSIFLEFSIIPSSTNTFKAASATPHPRGFPPKVELGSSGCNGSPYRTQDDLSSSYYTNIFKCIGMLGGLIMGSWSAVECLHYIKISLTFNAYTIFSKYL